MEKALKKEARVLGIDDGPYIRGSEKTMIVMTVYRLDGHIDGFITTNITTDGKDSSLAISNELRSSRFFPQIRCILSDGACLGGFNVLDLDDLHGRMDIPVITTSDERPKTESITKALKENFDDWEDRLEMIISHPVHELDLPDGPCFIREKGITNKMADDIVRRCTIRGRTPEPIRISHLVASAAHSLLMR